MNDAKWCPVDIYNYFSFDGNVFEIPKDNVDYKVYETPVKDKYGKWNNWKNRATMDQVLVVKLEDKYYFYNQRMEQIKVIKKKGSVV